MDLPGIVTLPSDGVEGHQIKFGVNLIRSDLEFGKVCFLDEPKSTLHAGVFDNHLLILVRRGLLLASTSINGEID